MAALKYLRLSIEDGRAYCIALSFRRVEVYRHDMPRRRPVPFPVDFLTPATRFLGRKLWREF